MEREQDRHSHCVIGISVLTSTHPAVASIGTHDRLTRTAQVFGRHDQVEVHRPHDDNDTHRRCRN